MTATNGWPDKPGVPLNPEEPGYHWVKGCDEEDTIVFWRGHGGDTHYENGDLKELDHWSGHPMWIAQEWTYLGPVPVLKLDEVTALQARAVKWAGIVGTLIAERDQLIGVLQIAIERSGDMEPRPAWVDGACGLLNKGFLKVDRAALAEAAALQKRCEEAERTALQAAECHARETRRADALQKRVAELEGALRNIAADCESDCPPSHGAIKYAARAALTGGKE